MNESLFSALATAAGDDPPSGDGLGDGAPPGLRQAVRIVNPQGLHMRPAAAFAQAAKQHTCLVHVRFGERRVDGKSFMDLLLLAAEPGSELEIEVSGPGAADALPALARILAADEVD